MMKRISIPIVILSLAASPSLADVELNEQLTLSGFIDMSSVNDNGNQSISMDQVEVDFIFNLDDGLSMRVDIEGAGDNSTKLEQAFISYDFAPGWNVVMGKYLSSSGWETAEPTGLYQYSTSSTLVYGGYQHGLGVSYSADKFGLFGSVVSSVWDGTDTDAEKPGFEAQVTLKPVDAVTAKVAYLSEDKGDYTQGLFNGWASYSAGPLTLAGELNLLSNWEADDNGGTGLLGMVNYGLTDKIGITGRFSSLDLDSAEDTESEFTISPSYALADNWSIITEAKFITKSRAHGGDNVQQYAVESLLSF